MVRKVFFSFDYDDIWAVNVVRNHYLTKGGYSEAGFIDKAEYEKLKREGVLAIKKWIDKQMEGTSVTVVLVGENTYLSEWVKYEIEKSIEKQNGLIEIYIHEIKDPNNRAKTKGTSPFARHFSGLSNYKVFRYNWVSDDGYNNFKNWVEKAAKSVNR